MTATATRAGSAAASPRVERIASRAAGLGLCDSCQHLRDFDLDDDIKTCPMLNIRIHVETSHIFGCTFWEEREHMTMWHCRQCGAVERGFRCGLSWCWDCWRAAMKGAAVAIGGAAGTWAATQLWMRIVR